METTDDIINAISKEEAIDKLDAIDKSLKDVLDVLAQNSKSSDNMTMATNVVSGHVLNLKETIKEDSDKTKNVQGEMRLTNKSVDDLTEKFAARIKMISDTATEANKQALSHVQAQALETVNTVKLEMEKITTKLVRNLQHSLDTTSSKVQPVVLVTSTSVKGNDRLKGRDLYDAGGGGGGGGSVDFSPTDYSDNQIAQLPVSSVVVFSSFNSFSVKAKGDGVIATVSGNTYALEDGETFGWGVTETAKNAVTISTDAASTAVVIYVNA